MNRSLAAVCAALALATPVAVLAQPSAGVAVSPDQSVSRSPGSSDQTMSPSQTMSGGSASKKIPAPPVAASANPSSSSQSISPDQSVSRSPGSSDQTVSPSQTMSGGSASKVPAPPTT